MEPTLTVLAWGKAGASVFFCMSPGEDWGQGMLGHLGGKVTQDKFQSNRTHVSGLAFIVELSVFCNPEFFLPVMKTVYTPMNS